MLWQTIKTQEFNKWISKLNNSWVYQIEARLKLIKELGHFGNYRPLGSGLYELKWKNGLRVYYCFYGKQIVFLLIGGFKDAQDADIKKAKKLQEAYST
jgi:putative addiction module killer protein